MLIQMMLEQQSFTNPDSSAVKARDITNTITIFGPLGWESTDLSHGDSGGSKLAITIDKKLKSRSLE